MTGHRGQLVLHYPELDNRVSLLFEKMKESRALRESFLRDPSAILWASLFDGEPNEHRAKLSSANRLLYCFLADPGMGKWANDYTAQILAEYAELASINDPVERKREFMLRLDRNRVARDFGKALARVGGPDLIAAIVDSEGSIDPVRPMAVAGPVAAVPVVVVAYVALFVALETEFAVHQHNALWGPPQTLPELQQIPQEEVANWLGLTRTNLKTVADVLAGAMATSAERLKADGALSTSADEVQAMLDKLSIDGLL